MTRNYGRIKVTIWADDDFRQLGAHAQLLYLHLLSSSSMNLCGVCDWRPKRLALMTSGLTERDIQKAGAELAAARYIVIDPDSDEVLVRTFIKHESVMVNPKTAAGLAAAFASIASLNLQAAVAYELRNLADEMPDLKTWHHVSDALDYRPDWVPDWVSHRLSDSVPIHQEPFTKSLIPRDGNHEPRDEAREADLDTEFDQMFWPEYPKKVDKGHARKAYRTARRKTTAEAIASSLRVFVRAQQGQPRQFIPNAATWLNGERWDDDAAHLGRDPANAKQAETDAQFARMLARAAERDAQQKAISQ